MLNMLFKSRLYCADVSQVKKMSFHIEGTMHFHLLSLLFFKYRQEVFMLGVEYIYIFLKYDSKSHKSYSLWVIKPLSNGVDFFFL